MEWSVCDLEFEADRENEAAAVSTNAWISGTPYPIRPCIIKSPGEQFDQSFSFSLSFSPEAFKSMIW